MDQVTLPLRAQLIEQRRVTRNVPELLENLNQNSSIRLEKRNTPKTRACACISLDLCILRA